MEPNTQEPSYKGKIEARIVEVNFAPGFSTRQAGGGATTSHACCKIYNTWCLILGLPKKCKKNVVGLLLDVFLSCPENKAAIGGKEPLVLGCIYMKKIVT